MNHHALIISQDSGDDKNVHSRALREIIDQLKRRSFEVTCTLSFEDGSAALEAHRDISVLILDWDICKQEASAILKAASKGDEALKKKTLELNKEAAEREALQGMTKLAVGSPTPHQDVSRLHLVRYSSAVVPVPDKQRHSEALTPAEKEKQIAEKEKQILANEINEFRKRNTEVLPIFIWTDRLELSNIPLEFLEEIDGYIWKTEDTPSFVAGRLETASQNLHERITPPFFKALVKHVTQSNYAWHTPGHMGGGGFLRSAVGMGFYEFFGENMLRADLSVSVPQLGSLLDHDFAVQQAETEAARTFKASRTYFVTNGTSTSNQIVFHGTVNRGDVVLIDRNCHKTSMQAIVTIGCIPIYLQAKTNKFDIIGPVPESEFTPESIRSKIEACPLIPEEQREHAFKNIKLAVLTNSTYDGICYDIRRVKALLAVLGVKNIMFDEAWFSYACFHEFFQNRYAMHAESDSSSEIGLPKEQPRVFSTQSTHKVLTALSQGSMIHVQHPKGKKEEEERNEKRFHSHFNESFMMHTSTSPQYSIIASLDIASKTMELSGEGLVREAIAEALTFRVNMEDLKSELKNSKRDLAQRWWFNVWQPEAKNVKESADDLMKMKTDLKTVNAAQKWLLEKDAPWHGFSFQELSSEYALLDPTKVTLYADGIPASVVSKFLMRKGIFVEKTGDTSFLVLFTIGVARGKVGTLVSELFEFKRAYDKNLPLTQVLPEFSRLPALEGTSRGLKDLCDALSKEQKDFIVHSSNPRSTLPEQRLLPADAYAHLVKDEVELVPLNKLKGRVATKILLPYPPAIPLVMPGEVFSENMVTFLEQCERLESKFPGCEIVNLHGIEKNMNADKDKYAVYCVLL